ncbi:MAG: tol-pal system protein YbgF, partial [Proteobacteria bacterium]|nr:tol-pal system protein YbgF [Pseudomonadota bacterium]
ALVPKKSKSEGSSGQKQIKANNEGIKDLKTKNEKLVQSNASLKLQIKKFKTQLEKLSKGQMERLKNMDYTISLLELSIKDLQKQYVAGLSKNKVSSNRVKEVKKNKTENRKMSAELGNLVKGSVGIELKTPATSKAIENFTLRPFNSKMEKPKKVAVPEKKQTKPVESSWEDPDLQVPNSPIFLEVYPGAKSHYNKAFKSYTRRDYTKAIDQFEEFLVRYPSDQYADNSQFWIGEAYFNLKDYRQSEHAFRKVLRNYEHGETREGHKTPDSILMLGRIYLIRNKPIKARKYFEHVKKNYSGSRSAEKSIKEIQSMQSL